LLNLGVNETFHKRFPKYILSVIPEHDPYGFPFTLPNMFRNVWINKFWTGWKID